MLTVDEINEQYKCYKNDLNISIELPNLLILPKFDQTGIAQTGRVIIEFAELFINKAFYDKTVNKKYLYQMLYHEFTHIVDRVSFFSEVTDEKQHRKLLFPYTEYHASQIEMKKRIELFYNPLKAIRKSTIVYDKYNSITIESFLENEKEQFLLRIQELEVEPNIENIQSIMYLLIYNFGYYSVCRDYNIDNELFINPRQFPYILNDINELKELLLNTKPSGELCRKSSKLKIILQQKSR